MKSGRTRIIALVAALLVCSLAIAQVPVTPAEKGQQAYASGHYQEALQYFQETLKAQP